MTDKLLTLPEVADRLRIPLSSLYDMRTRGTAPLGIRVGRGIRVRESALEHWLEANADEPRPAV